jgi:hypothetical protein
MSKGAGTVVAVRGNLGLAEPTRRIVAAERRTTSSQSPQEESRHYYSWLDSYLQWLDGKEAREEYYGRLEQVYSR